MPPLIRQKKTTFKMNQPLDYEGRKKAPISTLIFILIAVVGFSANVYNIFSIGFLWYRLAFALFSLIFFFKLVKERNLEKKGEQNKMI